MRMSNTSTNAATTSNKWKCMNLNYWHYKGHVFILFHYVGGVIVFCLLIRVWLCRLDGEGKKAWDRLGRLGEVPMNPWHPSTEASHVQKLSNRVKDLLQDVCRGFYRKLRVFYRMSLNCYRMVYRGGLRWGKGDGRVGRDVRDRDQAGDGSGMEGWDGKQV